MPKFITTISLFIFWAIVTAIIAVGLVYYQNNTNAAKSNVVTNNKTPATTQPTKATATPVVTTLSQSGVAQHNSAKNCWMIISSKVYDFTSFITSHPGGSSMVPYCGRDATNSFLSGPPHRHSNSAKNLLSQYYIGDLN